MLKLVTYLFLGLAGLAVIGQPAPPGPQALADKRSAAAVDLFYPQSTDPRQRALERTAVVKFAWRKGGFGTVMILESITIENEGAVRVKDLRIDCDLYAPSGTQLQSASAMLFEVVGARKTRTFRDVTVGVVHSQVTRADCRIGSVKLG